MSVYFCSGQFCPGYHWPASNTPHPTSCAIERLNSEQNLREAAASRRAHGRSVKFWEPEPPAKTRLVATSRYEPPTFQRVWKDDPDESRDDE